jgi:hypothetical protein
MLEIPICKIAFLGNGRGSSSGAEASSISIEFIGMPDGMPFYKAFLARFFIKLG